VATGCAPQFALWGGLMTTRAMHLKAAGAVLDGWSRDTPEVLQMGLPVFSYGGYAQDQGPRGKVVDWRVPVEINGVRVKPGRHRLRRPRRRAGDPARGRGRGHPPRAGEGQHRKPGALAPSSAA
jgi:hypothetical protein